jgi:putative MATE family efflux protein
MAKVENITSGPVYSTIFRLAWPVVGAMLLEFALSITDYFWVGFLGTPEQDAVTSALIVIWTMYALVTIIITGLTALIARSIGEADEKKASFIARQGILMAIGIGITLSIAGYIATPSIMKFMKASDEVIDLGVPYLRIFFLGMVFFFKNDALGSIFRASGDTKSPTIAFALATVINIFLDPVLIFGLGPFPEMGVAGAALATLISVIICFLILVTLLVRGKLTFPIGSWYKIRPSLKMMGKIFRIGFPFSLLNVTFVLVYWFIIQIVHHYGDAAGAAMGIGNRMEAISYLTALGFSTAASTMVGQNLGAGKPGRADRCAWGTAKIIVVETIIVSVLFITIPKTIAGIFTSDPEVLKIAVDYLIILGLSQVFMGIEIILGGAFSGAGDTIPPMLVSIPGSIARLPLAYYLCFSLDLGINGVWWSLTITSFLKAIILFLWFKRGNWKKKQL